jgi:Effector-associated domain 1
VPDIVMSAADRMRFLNSLTTTFYTVPRVIRVLDDIGFPRGSLSAAEGPVEDMWREVLHELQSGRLQDGVRTLLETILVVYPHHETFVDLSQRYATASANGDNRADPVDPPVENRAEQEKRAHFCHVLIRGDGEEARLEAQRLLADAGLAPVEIWSTNHDTLFLVHETDAGRVRQRLAAREGMDWMVIPPGGQTYLLSQLIVQGPDGRSFRFRDTPAEQTVADLAADTLAEYPDHGADRRAVTDLVQSNGQGVRLSPDSTLHDAQVGDGSRLRVAYETNAGAINPLYHAEALVRAGNQIRAFADAHPGIAVYANAPDLATVYELEFKVPSLGPPEEGREDPVDIEDHVVQLEFGPNFPQVAPMVFWVTPIFHPNIWPNYDCERARRYPARKGYVCLGDLTDAYQPALDLGQLCQTLLDVAAFRNYSVWVQTGHVSLTEDGQIIDEHKGNAFDPIAARWVLKNLDRIAKMGGRVHEAPPPREDNFRNDVEDYNPSDFSPSDLNPSEAEDLPS